MKTATDQIPVTIVQPAFDQSSPVRPVSSPPVSARPVSAHPVSAHSVSTRPVSTRSASTRFGPTSSVLFQATIESPVGTLQLIASDTGIRALLWPTDEDRVRVGSTELVEIREHSLLATTAQQLCEYFSGTRTYFDVALDPIGTEFQLDAWQALRAIPFGKTVSYAEQAAKIGRPKAVRAVGAANGKNPISIIVPCHRVIGSNGSLTGFAAGVDAKRWLLDHEKRIAGESLF